MQISVSRCEQIDSGCHRTNVGSCLRAIVMICSFYFVHSSIRRRRRFNNALCQTEGKMRRWLGPWTPNTVLTEHGIPCTVSVYVFCIMVTSPSHRIIGSAQHPTSHMPNLSKCVDATEPSNFQPNISPVVQTRISPNYYLCNCATSPPSRLVTFLYGSSSGEG